LNTINNKAKVRRPTKSLVLGKAKVISYKDLKEAQAKRANKEAAKEAKGKGKRSRKRKSTALEADVLELNAKVVRMSEALAPPVAEDEIVLEP
jgi:multidrug resistance efflux pump